MSSKGRPAYYDEQGRRYCLGCQQMKTRENFGGEGKYANALCKECKTDKAAINRQLNLGKKVHSALEALTTHVSRGGDIPHTQELVEALMDCCGGPQTLMRLFWDSLKEAELGSMTAHKYFDTAFRLVEKNVVLGGAKKPRDLMTVEDLKARVLQIVDRKENVVDAEVEEEEDYDAELRALPNYEGENDAGGLARDAAG